MKRPFILGLSAIVACVTLSQFNDARAIIPEVVDANFQRTADSRLANQATSAETLEQILSRRDAVKILTETASNGEADPAARGWAILGLSQVRADTRITLDQIRDDGSNSMLVRTWAASARLQRASTMRELVEQSVFVNQYPGLDRPFKQKVSGLLDGSESLEELMQLSANFPQLSAQIGQSILAADTSELVELIYHGKDNNIRRQAASYAAAQAQGDPEVVGAAIIGALTYRGGTPPWAGNALFIPNVGWTAPQGQELVGELIRWSVYCSEDKELTAERQQIWNNLMSVGLLYTAGYNGSIPSDPIGMVKRYGEVMGKSAMRDMIRDLGLSEDPRYAKLIKR